MLTPRFELYQDEEFLTVLIKTPYVKLSNVEFYISGTEFKFYVKPYFLRILRVCSLCCIQSIVFHAKYSMPWSATGNPSYMDVWRLNLPAEVVEDGRECASYDVEKGTMTVKLPKLNKGEHFDGLDLLTKLLAPGKKSLKQPLIEIVGTSTEVKVDSDSDSEEYDWEVEQIPSSQEDVKLCLGLNKCGFAGEKSGVFTGRQEELHEIAEIRDPECMSASEKRSARLAAEDLKFDEEHYLADLFNDEQIQGVMLYQPPWEAEYKEWTDQNKDKEVPSPADGTLVTFTEEEKDLLRRLPNKEYLLDESVEMSLLLGLVDIIFAYAYNHRTTEGENTVESPWTISKISCTFSWFESFTSLTDVLVACFRRSLCQPLYRHWAVSCTVLEDTKKIFLLGRRRLLKCLLEVHGLFAACEPWYIMSDLYVTDYCVWIQKTSSRKLESLAKSVEKVQIHKENIGWVLEELEAAALAVQEEEEKGRDRQDGSSNDRSSSSSSSSSEEEEEEEEEEDDEEEDDEEEEDKSQGEEEEDKSQVEEEEEKDKEDKSQGEEVEEEDEDDKSQEEEEEEEDEGKSQEDEEDEEKDKECSQ